MQRDEGSARRITILLAEDEAEYRRLATMVLRSAGYDVTPVEDGQNAILAIEVAAVARRPYDLLLLDIVMPGASGWDVLRHARARTPLGSVPPRVLLVTGYEAEYDLEKMRREGAMGIVLKPTTGPGLVEEVERVLALPPPEAHEAPAAG